MPRRLPRWLEPAVYAARLALVRAAVRLGDATRARRPGRPLRAAWAPGVSVLIPERGTPALLARALAHLEPALLRLDEPWEIVVVVNGEPAATYAALQARWPRVRWQFHQRPLGYGGALAEGLRAVRLGGVYLHNSDMALDEQALALLLPWRAPQVFAIASQIEFDDPARRREETGWGDLRLHEGHAQLYDRWPESGPWVRGGLYAGGGSSLFDTALLKRFAADTGGYAPFYWEDADWGLQAWRNGLEVLFQPASRALHRHRATIGRCYDAAEIDRIVARNGLLFELRHFDDPAGALREAARSPWPTVKELAGWSTLAELRRVRARRPCCPAVDIERRAARVHARPPSAADRRPLVLVVSPYRVLPPQHGGAWRTWRLCEALQDRCRYVLLSDEGTGYTAEAWAAMGPFDSVHLVQGRPDGPTDRIGRMRSHSHAALQAELDRLALALRPDLVQIEHVELAGLRAPAGVPTLLVAHDVHVAPGAPDEADRHELAQLARFDAVVACSPEDAALLVPLPAVVVPNGAVLPPPGPTSAGRSGLLFAGPFRYPPNLAGLRVFLAEVYPALRERVPGLTLTVLAGEGGAEVAAADPLLRQGGVHVEGPVSDVRPWLADCALTINPLSGIRGSSVKLIESLAASRVCVSTRDGARGFADAGLPGLVVADDVAAMLEPLAALLLDEPRRLALERADPQQLRPYGWAAAAQPLHGLYLRLLAGRTAPPRGEQGR